MGEDAVNALTDMISSYGDYQDSLNQASQSTGNFSDAAGDAARALRDQQKQIEDWTRSQLTAEDSPLLPAEKLKAALDRYEQVVNAGDRDHFTSAADDLKKIARDYYASGTDYTEIWNRIIGDAQRLGGFSLGANAPDGPKASIDALRAEMAARAAQERSDRQNAEQQMREAIETAKQNSREEIAALERAINNQTTTIQGFMNQQKRD